MLARYVLQIVLTWSSTLLPRSFSAFFPLVCLEFHSLIFKIKIKRKIWKFRLHFFSLNVSVLVGKHRAIGERAQVWFWRESFSLFTTAKRRYEVLFYW